GWLNEAGVRDVLDTNVAGAEHDSCAHDDLPPGSGGLEGGEGAGARLAQPTVHARDDDDFSFDAIAHNPDSCLSPTAPQQKLFPCRRIRVPELSGCSFQVFASALFLPCILLFDLDSKGSGRRLRVRAGTTR